MEVNKETTKPVSKQPVVKKTEKKGTDASKIVLIILVVALLGAVGYLVFNKTEQDKTITTQTTKIEETTKEKDKALKELEDMKARFEALKGEKEALNISNDSLNTIIADLEAKIKRYRNQQGTINNLKAELSKYKDEYIKQKDNHDNLIRSNDSLRLAWANLNSEIKLVRDTVRMLMDEKKDLQEKVELASVLRAENIKVSVMSAKGKEAKPAAAYKAKSVGKLKLVFNLADNKVAKRESKEIYLRVIEPSGSTLFEGDKIFMVDGKETFYTDKQSVDFNNTKQQVAFIYNKGSAYKPGKYTIEFYADGQSIGETALTLK